MAKRTSRSGVQVGNDRGLKQYVCDERAPRERGLETHLPDAHLPNGHLLNEQVPNQQVLNQRCLELRRIMHELSNIMTGLMMSSGLLSEALQGDARRRYTQQLLPAGERGAALVREARELLHAGAEGGAGDSLAGEDEEREESASEQSRLASSKLSLDE